MMDEKKSKWFLPLFILGTIIYEQIVFNVLAFNHLTFKTVVYIVLFSVLISGVIYLLCNLFKSKVNHILTYSLLGSIIIIIEAQYIYNIMYQSIISFYSLFKGTGQVLEFASQIITTIRDNIPGMLIIVLPIIGLIACDIFKISDYKRIDIKGKLILIEVGMALHIIAIVSLSFIGTNIVYSNYNLYRNIHAPLLTADNMGLLTMMRIDIKRSVFGFTEKDLTMEEEKEVVVDKKKEYNMLNIDFDQLIADETDPTIKSMHEYFSKRQPSEKNTYTGMFKDKNLVVFVAEAFSQMAIDKELTPTLYKLYNEGFQFDNFYTPVFPVSTADGEYITDTSLIPKEGVWSIRRIKDHYMPYSYANVFENIGYTSQAYHDHYYAYYDRDVYINAMGYDSYRACSKGLKINCKLWPESDYEMIKDTVNDYINDDHFMAYYMTVSGHLEYNRWGNNMANRNWNMVKNLPYSDAAKSYLAANIELDKAVAELIKDLEASGKLDDTVIAISADHYPYGLSIDQINEISTYKRDPNFEIHHMPFLLWNSTMEKPIKVTKMASSLDVLPTILNLFGVNYDSRLLIGSDILSNSEGLVIFSNRSFITNEGRYNSITKKFTGNEVANNYVEQINLEIHNKYKYSSLVLEQDYYRKLYTELGWLK